MQSSPTTIDRDQTLFPEIFSPIVSTPGFQLTASDIKMIRCVFEYRFLHIDHVSALLNRSYKKAHGRLLKLVQNHFLARIELPFQKHIYVIGREGINVLVEQGIASREAIEWRLRHHELKELFLKHQLMLGDLHCMLDLAGRESGITLDTWREGKELWDTVDVWQGHERVALPVCPDAFVILRDPARPEGRDHLNFFVEADRSTTTHKRFQKKIVAYRQYLEDDRCMAKLGIKTTRVVTFTLTEERARGLRDAARNVLPSAAFKYFLFAPMDALSLANPAAILSDMFMRPHRGDGPDLRYRLVPRE